MSTFHEIYEKRLDTGLNIRLTSPELCEALRKYAMDNRDGNGVSLSKDEAVAEILWFFLIGNKS